MSKQFDLTPEQVRIAREVLAEFNRPSSSAPAPAAMPPGHVPCCYCDAPNRVERVEIGKTHCTDRSCIARWRRDENERLGLRLMLQPKVGLQWVSDPRNLTYGKSSGR